MLNDSTYVRTWYCGAFDFLHLINESTLNETITATVPEI